MPYADLLACPACNAHQETQISPICLPAHARHRRYPYPPAPTDPPTSTRSRTHTTPRAASQRLTLHVPSAQGYTAPRTTNLRGGAAGPAVVAVEAAGHIFHCFPFQAFMGLLIAGNFLSNAIEAELVGLEGYLLNADGTPTAVQKSFDNLDLFFTLIFTVEVCSNLNPKP